MRHFLVLAALVTAGCYTAVQMHSDTLRSRASFDLRCPQPQLQVIELSSDTAGVDGCGQRATYVYERHGGTWLMNSPQTDQPPPPAAAEPPGPPPAAPPPPPGQPPPPPPPPPR